MEIDEEIILSAPGRQVLERALRTFLQARENYRATRSAAIRQAFRSDQILIQDQERCSALCHDLGYVSEAEAIQALLGGLQTGQACCENWSAPEEPAKKENR